MNHNSTTTQLNHNEKLRLVKIKYIELSKRNENHKPHKMGCWTLPKRLIEYLGYQDCV